MTIFTGFVGYDCCAIALAGRSASHRRILRIVMPLLPSAASSDRANRVRPDERQLDWRVALG
jgi:hypothetical protein